MNLRAATAVSLTVVLAMSGVASGAIKKKKPPPPKPVCNLVQDAQNDTFAVRPQDGKVAGPQEDALDITTVDIASNATTVTAVMRVKKLSATPTTSPYGTSYEVEWQIPGTDNSMYLAAAQSTKDGNTFTAGYRDPLANGANKLADATGVFDVAKNEIRISAPVSAFAGQGSGMKPGIKITFGDLDQTASRNGVAVSIFADVVTSGATYLTGYPSCVVVGK